MDGMDSQPTPQPFYRTRGWLIGTTAVLVAAIVVLVVVLTLTGGGPGRPRDPQAAANAWAKARLHNQKDVVTSLQCSPTLSTAIDALQFTGQEVTGLNAGTAVPDGSDRWAVPMKVEAGTISTTINIHVVRRNGDYLVCNRPFSNGTLVRPEPRWRIAAPARAPVARRSSPAAPPAAPQERCSSRRRA
jgi:hypothetical protein